jgi:hypothetical protein
MCHKSNAQRTAVDNEAARSRSWPGTLNTGGVLKLKDKDKDKPQPQPQPQCAMRQPFPFNININTSCSMLYDLG